MLIFHLFRRDHRMNESDHDGYEMGKAVSELNIDSMPVNFLHPIKGTKLSKMLINLIRCIVFKYLHCLDI